MNEMQFGHRIRQLLTQGAQVRPDVARQLAAARMRALEHQRAEVTGLVWADNIVGRMGGWSGFALRVLLPIALVVGSGAALYSWQQNRLAAEVEEIDAQLLTDDLPIDAYLDRGFQNWLKKRAADQ